MSRKLQRQMKQAAQRKEDMLTEYVLKTYGPETHLADLHPDVRELFAHASLLHLGMLCDNDDMRIRATADICALITRYADQDLKTDDTPATMLPEPATGHGDEEILRDDIRVAIAQGEAPG